MGRARTTLEPRSKVNHRTIAPEEVLAQSKIHPTSRLGSGLEVGFLRSIFFHDRLFHELLDPERLVQRLLLVMYVSICGQPGHYHLFSVSQPGSLV